MSAKYLIVNADDYNTDSERNQGILQAVLSGIVTSVSVIANLHGEDEALAKVKRVMGTRIGIHLNLTKGKPLVPGLKTLTDERGFFHPRKTAWRKALLGKFDMKEVEEEFAAQVEALNATRDNPGSPGWQQPYSCIPRYRAAGCLPCAALRH